VSDWYEETEDDTVYWGLDPAIPEERIEIERRRMVLEDAKRAKAARQLEESRLLGVEIVGDATSLTVAELDAILPRGNVLTRNLGTRAGTRFHLKRRSVS
jgi:hypothetical protein